MIEKLPVPEYGVVPPIADTVQLKDLPAVNPDVGHCTVTTKGWEATLTLALAVPILLAESVTVLAML